MSHLYAISFYQIHIQKLSNHEATIFMLFTLHSGHTLELQKKPYLENKQNRKHVVIQHSLNL